MNAITRSFYVFLLFLPALFLATNCPALENLSHLVTVEKTAVGGGGGFRRGDCNADGKIDISDAICTLNFLFGDGGSTCLDSLDNNDDGSVDIADPIYILTYLFSGGDDPAAPFMVCGKDLTLDKLNCLYFAPCTGNGEANTYIVKLRNSSKQAVLSPLIAVVESITPSNVSVNNPDGQYEGKPYFSFTENLSGGMLSASEETEEQTWVFDAPNGIAFNFTVRVMGELNSGWLPMEDSTGEGSRTPERKVQGMDFNGVSFEVKTPGVSFSTRTNGKGAFIKMVAPNTNYTGHLGGPEIPAYSQYVVVPKDSQVVVEVIKGKSITYKDIKVWPRQYCFDDNLDADPPPFIQDKKVYSQNTLFPRNLSTVTESEFRGSRIALVQVALAQTNPVTSKLILYPELKVNISFRGGKGDKGIEDFIKTGDLSVASGSLLKVTALNYGILEKQPSVLLADRISRWFYDLLIISDRAFETQAEELAEHKRDLGFDTHVHYTDVIGDTVEEIDNHIASQYLLGRIDYVILFGDAEHIPPHYITRHPTGNSPNKIGTDLYYATMGGAGDLVPDIAIGRIPVNSAEEAQIVVDKIIDYETSPPSSFTHSDFYSRVALAAYFQDNNNNGRADREFAETIEEIFNFFDNEGYAPERSYTTNSDNPEEWDDGTNIPAHLEDPPFHWDGDSGDISAMINSGSFLLAHRDHGNRSGWSYPSYTTNNIAGLTNDNLLPVVFSINCQTGWFDTETDEEGANTAGETFAERFLTKNGGGAIAVFAATRNSPSGPNNELLLGMLDCIWPDMIPGYPTDTDAEASDLAGTRNLGWVLNYGKLRVLNQYPTQLDGPPNLDNITLYQREFEIYHLLGDPTLCIRTQAPVSMAIATIVLQPYQSQYLISISSGLKGVKFALVQDGKVVAKGVGDDREVTLNLPDTETLKPDEDTYLVAEGEGFLPYKKKVEFKADVTPRSRLYCFEVLTDEAGKSALAEFDIERNFSLQLQTTFNSNGIDRSRTSLSGFCATRRYLFAGHNESGQVEMLAFTSSSGLKHISFTLTEGGKPAYMVADESSDRIIATTSDRLIETFAIGSSGLKALQATNVKNGRLRDLAKYAYRGRTFLYIGSQDSPPGIYVYQVKGDSLIPVRFYDLSKAGASRVGVKLEIVEKAARLYVRDLDEGVFVFNINKSTGELSLVKGSPFAVGGFGRTMTITHYGHYLYAGYSSDQRDFIGAFALNAAGALVSKGSVSAPPDIRDLVADPAERALYVASDDDKSIWVFEINSLSGSLKFQEKAPIKIFAPAALWTK